MDKLAADHKLITHLILDLKIAKLVKHHFY